ncbi:adenosine-specific kinase [candidate division WOR-3 bacterium]|nr:adenosine-specific kinase [candidate division WOR-3 bacterium]
MELKVIDIKKPGDVNLILAQSHFIKTVEDVYECLVTTVPGIKFGLAFVESSGPRLIRYSGTDDELVKLARENLMRIGAGHSLLILLKNAYPINILPRLKQVQEIVGIYCATANSCQVIVAETEKGRGILGVIDGETPLGEESEKEIKERKEFLRKIGYKQ